jgi:adenylate cyclase
VIILKRAKVIDTAKPQSVVRRSIFGKYVLVLFAAVVVPLSIGGASEAWFGYRDQRTLLDARLHVEASAAASKIQSFLDGIRDQMQWTVQLPWTKDNIEDHHIDALRLLKQVPAIVDVSLIDGAGIERLRVSRIERDVINSAIDRSGDPAVLGTRDEHLWYSPVTLNRGSEPYITIAVAGRRSATGVAVAQINLKLIWDVISAIHIEKTGIAFVIDADGRLVTHPNIDLVLRGADNATAERLRALRSSVLALSGESLTTQDVEQRTVLATMAPISGVNWSVVAEQPLSDAYAPIRAAFWRTVLLILAGAAFALGLAYVLARRMTGPIRLLEEGAARIGARQFDHKIDISTGDELERLAARFNQMAGELALSQERSERIARLKRFLSPQVAEIVENSSDGSLLEGRRTEVAVVFCDLRGFTDFSVRVEPEDVMRMLGEYYEAVGASIVRCNATLTHFSGDGLMILVNAPIRSSENPTLRALRMAEDMQAAVQALIVSWRARGQALGFGIGVAQGAAIVGRVGYESRSDYTAIGTVVNLASRLCAVAEDGQILVDSTAAAGIANTLALFTLGTRRLKGFPEPIQVYATRPASGAVDQLLPS